MQKIIHHIAVCGFIFLMSFKLLGGFSYNLYFWWNQKQLAKEHCINQNKPKLKCNGKCYLAKQLAKIENDYQKKQNEPAPFQLKSTEWFYIPTENVSLQIEVQERSKNSLYSWYSNLKSLYEQNKLTPPPDFV